MNRRQSIAITPVLIRGQEINIRQVDRQDAFLQTNAAAGRADAAPGHRYYGHFRALTDAEIEQLCDRQNPHSMAFVAIAGSRQRKREVGVARYVLDIKGCYELAVMIDCDFHQSTLARTLVEYLIAYAKKHHIESFCCLDGQDNLPTQLLAEQLGMRARSNPDVADQLIYSLRLEERAETVAL